MFDSLFNKNKNKSINEDFHELYNENFDYIYSFVLVRTACDAQITEDIVQETFTAAWQAQDRFQNKCAYRTWVCAIAKNKLKEHYRKTASTEKNEIDDEGLDEESSGFNLESAVLLREKKAQVAAALNRINPVYKYSLIMKYIDGYSVKEISGQLGRTAKAVDGLLQKAKKSFMREYSKMEGRTSHE